MRWSMSVTWEEPKTDWSATYNDSGLFIGDFFNVTDYNRIKNNLLYLRELATELMINVPKIVVGEDKHLPDNENPDIDNDYFYADEINLIEDGLKSLDERFTFVDFGDKQTFYDNGKFIDAAELNRIEKAELKMYNLLQGSIAGKSRLAIRLGMRENAIRP